MSCLDIEDKLSAYADGELPPGERPAVDAHLASCGECRRALEMLRAQHRELEGAFAPLREGADALARRVISAVHEQPLPVSLKRRSAGMRWLPMIASAAAGFLAAWLVFRSPEREPIEGFAGKSGPGYGQQQLAEQAAPPAARLTLATGSVEFREGKDGWANCSWNDTLPVGSWVRTAPRTKCSFAWSDGSELYLNQDTEIQLASPRAIQLSRGEVYALANEQASPFRVDTPPGSFEANGASVNLLFADRKGEPYVRNFAVTQGYVQTFPAKGQRLELESPDVLASTDGQYRAPEQTGKLVLATRWVHELLVLKGGDDPELERRVLALFREVGASKGRDPYEEEIRALGERAAPTLIRALKESRDADRRRHAARILADLAGPSLVPELVTLVRDPEGDVRQSCVRGLQRVTGQPLRDDPNAWNAWFKDNEAVWGTESKQKKSSLSK